MGSKKVKTMARVLQSAGSEVDVREGEAASAGPVSVRANGNAMPSLKIRLLSTGKSSVVRG
jgi:hypothetical protein